MRSYGQRDRKKVVRLFLKRVGLVALLLLVGVAGSGVWRVYQKEKESRLLRHESEVELSDLETRKDRLSKELDELGTSRGKETILRERYALASAGEGMIVIVDPSATQTSATTTPQETQSWLHKILSWW